MPPSMDQSSGSQNEMTHSAMSLCTFVAQTCFRRPILVTRSRLGNLFWGPPFTRFCHTVLRHLVSSATGSFAASGPLHHINTASWYWPAALVIRPRPIASAHTSERCQPKALLSTPIETELNWFYWAHLQPWGAELLNKLYNNTMIQTIKND